MKIIPTPEKAVYSSKLVSEKERQYLIDTSLLKEEYAVKIDDEGKVLISYSDEAGRFYAEQTLKQLKNEKNLYPVCKIEDSPRFSYRGFMLDCARHIIPIDEIKKIIDAMALLKFSRFHWHLTDDQGWRFESEKFPVLNTVSAVREYSDFGKTYDIFIINNNKSIMITIIYFKNNIIILTIIFINQIIIKILTINNNLLISLR